MKNSLIQAQKFFIISALSRRYNAIIYHMEDRVPLLNLLHKLHISMQPPCSYFVTCEANLNGFITDKQTLKVRFGMCASEVIW